MRFRRLALAFAASLTTASLAIATTASATTVVPITVEALSRRADEVLVVTPRAASAHWLAREIVTDYQLEVQSVVHGSATVGSRVTLRAPGGIVDRVGQRIPGVPTLEIGRPYVVFLSHATDGTGVNYLTHLTASVLPVSTAPDGAIVVTPAAEGMRVAVSAPTAAAALASDATVMRRDGVALETLVRVMGASR